MLAVGGVERQLGQQPGLDPEGPLFSIDVSTYVWQGFLREVGRQVAESNFRRPPDGLVPD